MSNVAAALFIMIVEGKEETVTLRSIRERVKKVFGLTIYEAQQMIGDLDDAYQNVIKMHAEGHTIDDIAHDVFGFLPLHQGKVKVWNTLAIVKRRWHVKTNQGIVAIWFCAQFGKYTLGKTRCR